MRLPPEQALRDSLRPPSPPCRSSAGPNRALASSARARGSRWTLRRRLPRAERSPSRSAPPRAGWDRGPERYSLNRPVQPCRRSGRVRPKPPVPQVLTAIPRQSRGQALGPLPLFGLGPGTRNAYSAASSRQTARMTQGELSTGVATSNRPIAAVLAGPPQRQLSYRYGSGGGSKTSKTSPGVSAFPKAQPKRWRLGRPIGARSRPYARRVSPLWGPGPMG